MRKYVDMYVHGALIDLKSRLTYKLNFGFDMFTMCVVNLFIPLMTVLIYTNSEGIPGWGMYELLLLQGIFMTVQGLSYPFFFGIVWRTINSMRRGTLDMYVLKPLHPIFSLVIHSFDSEDLGMLVGGLTVTLGCIIKLGITNVVHIAGAMCVMLLGVLMFFGISLLASAFTLRFVQTWRIYEVIDMLNHFTQYPAHIYGRFIAMGITFLYPLVVMSSYPAMVMLGRPVEFIPVIAVIIVGFVMIAYQLWMEAFSNYSSAGG